MGAYFIESPVEKFLKLPRFSFTLAMVEDAPDTPGVYGLFDGGDLIYVGKTSRGISIKSCLESHQNGSLGQCTKIATAYAWEITGWPSVRETEILSRFFAAHCQEPLCQRETLIAGR